KNEFRNFVRAASDSKTAGFLSNSKKLRVFNFWVKNWPDSDWQIDAQFPKFLPPSSKISRNNDLGDSIMTAIILSSFEEELICFNDLGRLRVQECDRVSA